MNVPGPDEILAVALETETRRTRLVSEGPRSEALVAKGPPLESTETLAAGKRQMGARTDFGGRMEVGRGDGEPTGETGAQEAPFGGDRSSSGTGPAVVLAPGRRTPARSYPRSDDDRWPGEDDSENQSKRTDEGRVSSSECATRVDLTDGCDHLGRRAFALQRIEPVVVLVVVVVLVRLLCG